MSFPAERNHKPQDSSSLLGRVRSFLNDTLMQKKNQRFYEFVGIVKNQQIPNINLFSNAEIESFVVKPVDSKSKKTLLHLAAEMDNSKLLEFLLDYACEVNPLDRNEATPIMTCFGKLDFDKIKLFVEKGAQLNSVDIHGNNPIDEVVLNDRADILQYLLNNGLYPNLCYNESDQQTLLHLACSVGSFKQVCLLVEHNASMYLMNANGQSPIHLAVMNDHLEIVEYLISRGDDINHLDNNQMTPLNYAREYGATKVEEMLKRKKAYLRDDIWLNMNTGSGEEELETA